MDSLVEVETEPLDFQDVYDELEAFVYWLSERDSQDIWLMDSEELQGELFEEMWKVFLHYKDDIHDIEEMKAVLRRTFDYRVRELRHKYAGTHRKMGLYEDSLDSPDDAEDHASADYLRSVLEDRIVLNIGATVSIEPDEMLQSEMRVKATRNRLTPVSRAIFDAVIGGDPILEAQVRLSGVRAREVYKGRGTIKIKHFHVANALALDESEVKEAFKEIRRTYAEVCCEFD